MKCHNRTVEACLLLVSSTIIVAAYVLASIGRYSSLPANIVLEETLTIQGDID